MGQSENRQGLFRDLSIALAGAFAFRLFFLLIMRRVIDMADAIHYINMARQFAGGDFRNFDDNLPILYPALGALAHLFVADWEWSFWIVSLVSSSLLVIPVYLLSRELHGQGTARVAALLVCLWPWLVDYGGRIVPDALAVTLWFLSIWLIYRGLNNGGLTLWLAPLSFFALHLSRPEGTFLMMAAPVAGLVLVAGRGRERYVRAAIFCAACAGLLVVYAFTMKAVIGAYTVSYRAPMSGDMWDYITRGAVDAAKTFIRLLFNALPVMLGPFLFLFLGVGVFTPTDKPRNARLALVIGLFCAVQWGMAMANVSPAPRYIMAVVVALSLWSAHGIVVVANGLARRPHGRWLKRVPLTVVVCAMLLGTATAIAPDVLGRIPHIPREYKIVGEWMREHVEPGLIICRKPQIGFYAGMPTSGPAIDDDVSRLVERAVQAGARYVVYDERYSAGIVPGLRALLDPANAPPELKLLRDDLSPYPNAKVVVYEVVSPGMHYIDPDDYGGSSSHMGPDQKRRKITVTPDG